MRGNHRAMTAGLVRLMTAAGAAAATDSNRLKSRAIAGTATTGASGNVFGTIDSDELIGANLRDGRGESIGEIGGFLVNKACGPVGVIVDVRGLLVLSARQIVVPLDHITLADSRVLLSAVPKQKLERFKPYSSTLR